MTYQDIAQISESIRFVMHTSRQVSLTSLNASLAARKAGNVRGFRAVSVELKAFSQQLSQAMEQMVVGLYGVSESVSVIYRQRRMQRFQRAAERGAARTAALTSALQRNDHRLAVTNGVLAERLQGLQRLASQSLRLCSNGRALARSAMVEASSGGVFEAVLRNVAHDVERTIEGIHLSLKGIVNYIQYNA